MVLIRQNIVRVLLCIAFCVLALFAFSACDLIPGLNTSPGGTPGATGPPRDTTPVVLEPTQPGEAVNENDKAIIDYSNTADGYFCVRSKMGDTKVKVLVKVDGSQYQYTITNEDRYATIPLTQGDGSYDVGIWENITGDQYASVLSQKLEVTIADEFSPFLYPSQYVSFNADDRVVAKGQELATGSITDVDAIARIFDYVVKNITYDYDKAATVQPGYLPNPDATLQTGTGICFDYAVLTASMMRSQQVPVKLVIGYAGNAYHAWIQVYSTETGEVIGQYQFNGNEWVRMDPTFNASSKGVQDLSHLVGDGHNYQPMFYY
jgi:transglutaminase-like putative cysteine protease